MFRSIFRVPVALLNVFGVFNWVFAPPPLADAYDRELVRTFFEVLQDLNNGPLNLYGTMSVNRLTFDWIPFDLCRLSIGYHFRLIRVHSIDFDFSGNFNVKWSSDVVPFIMTDFMVSSIQMQISQVALCLVFKTLISDTSKYQTIHYNLRDGLARYSDFLCILSVIVLNERKKWNIQLYHLS